MKEGQILLLVEKPQELNRNTRDGDETKKTTTAHSVLFFLFCVLLMFHFVAPIN
jgi:hypothetical protein